jgi:hypothetical protein
MSNRVPDDDHMDSVIRILYPEKIFAIVYFSGLCTTISEQIHKFRNTHDIPHLSRNRMMDILGYGENKKKDRSLNYLYNSLHIPLVPCTVRCNDISFMSNTLSNDKHVMLVLLFTQQHDNLIIGKQISSDGTFMKKISDLKNKEERNRTSSTKRFDPDKIIKNQSFTLIGRKHGKASIVQYVMKQLHDIAKYRQQQENHMNLLQ